MKAIIVMFFSLLLFSCLNWAQNDSVLLKRLSSLESQLKDYEHRFDVLEKMIDDQLFYTRLQKEAYIDKVFIYGEPPAKVKDSSKVGALNPVKFWAYVFIPKGLNIKKKYPLIVFPHGGVHANFSTYYVHVLKELLAQGYVVIAPEYRGSTGYGKSFYEKIDYGGRETGDADASRRYMIENYPFIDSNRVGIFGWSHGGMIALMCLFAYPEHYKVGFAGVPVSDLIKRMEIHGKEYEDYFSAEYHIGKTVAEDPEEYKRRSPAYHANKLKTPLLLHTNTNDDDVYAIEVESLINALKLEGKDFEYTIYENMPGGHSFDRMDVKFSREIRFKTYQFIGKYLEPPHPYKSLKQLEKKVYYDL